MHLVGTRTFSDIAIIFPSNYPSNASKKVRESMEKDVGDKFMCLNSVKNL